MSVSVQNHSRLNFADLLTQDGFEFWDTLFITGIAEQSDDVRYTVRGGDRLDQIAYKMYGDPVLWWVLAVANDIELVPADVSEGQILRIPSPRYVRQILFTLKST
jgi:nucleoid-associated protein YgaU